MSEYDEERVRRLENDVHDLRSAMTSIASDFKYVREKIDNYLQTHDTVIRQQEMIKVANNRINQLEDDVRKTNEKMTAIAVKVAMISGGMSIGMTLLLNAINS